MSSRRRALQNHDVLHEIFTWLALQPGGDEITPEEEEDRRADRHDLLNAALVCKSFTGHALDALWRELDDLLPVMQLFTEAQDPEADGTVPDGALADGLDVSFSYLISETEWARFRHYARRVRVIRDSGFGTFEASMLLHLAQRNGGKPLFPCLRCLTHQVGSNMDTGLLPLVASTLESAKLMFCGETWYGIDAEESPAIARKMRDYAVQKSLTNLCTNAPELRRLTITDLGRASTLSPLLVCRQLRCLHIHDIVFNPRSLRSLASLETVRELDLKYELMSCDFSGCSGLIGVESVSLSAPMYQIPTVLDMISSTRVRTVRITDPTRRAAFQDCSDVVQIAAKFPCLDEFWLAADNSFVFSPDTSPPPSTPLMLLLAPLLQRRGLRTLSINRWQPGGFALGDDDVQTFADAWPGLQSLVLTVNRAEVIPTLDSLTIVARALPALVELELPSITILSAEQLRPRPELGPHPLRTFEVGDPDRGTEAFDAAAVAQWVHDIFPRFSMPGESEGFPDFLASLLGELERLHTEVPFSDWQAGEDAEGAVELPLVRAST
ncbi:hypothetical protein DAEQUDRAFT_761512 [Daedalea quercina L-15889]|uniref:F-box domain-containing protein n=1 Tax=Daedalea quercina L-15889 TaxID=1314783 RepID=A0A165TWJ3_9APHY|nr:hypothetical protein DAEQUDRAFT_761512 [Daedalea quercina L-15889]